MRAVDALMECLKAEGVDVVFGLPGGANLPTYDAFYDAGIRQHPRAPRGRRRPRGRGLRQGDRQGRRLAGHQRPRRDQPGDTDLRRDDGLGPGRVHHRPGPARDLLGTDGFQEADTIGITMPIVKHSFMIQHPNESSRGRSTRRSTSPGHGRPGPVVVDIPSDLSRADIAYEPVHRRAPARLSADHRPATRSRSAWRPRRWPTRGDRCCMPAAASSRPTLRPSSSSWRPSDKLPVTCTVMGLGAFPAPHAQWLGMLGMHGTRTANYAMDEADLIIADRRALRRPDHRQAGGVRAARQVHPHRHRPGRDLQERAGPHPDRR